MAGGQYLTTQLTRTKLGKVHTHYTCSIDLSVTLLQVAKEGTLVSGNANDVTTGLSAGSKHVLLRY